MSTWHKDYFMFVNSKKKQTESSENLVEGTLCKRQFTFVREISVCKDASLAIPGRGRLYHWKCLPVQKTIGLNLNNNVILSYCAFPGNLTSYIPNVSKILETDGYL